MSAAKTQLRNLVERIERLEEEKKAIADDIRDVYGEAKAQGYDVKALRRIVKMRKLSADERAEQEAVLGTYMAALGMHSFLGTDDGDVDKALERKRSEAGKAKAERAGTPPPKPRPAGEPRAGGMTAAEVKAAADRAEERSRGPP